LFEKFIKDYKENLSGYGLVFRYMKLYFRLFRFSIFLFMFSCVVLFITSLAFSKYVWWIVIFTIVVFLFLINSFVIFNTEAKKIINVKYGINSTGFLWNNEKYFNVVKSKLSDYLKNNDLLNEQKLSILINLLNQESNLRKFPPFVIPGLFLAFAIPIWDKVLDFLYNSAKDANTILAVTGASLILAIIIVSFLSLIKPQIEEMKDDIINKDSQTMKLLARRLEHIKLELPTE
jgi:hypothetical protein